MTGDQRLAGLSVLLLEDSYFVAAEAQATLEDAGARVLGPCRDLAEMLEALEGEQPNCALVDLNLGDGPTFEPSRALRAANVPIILMTGYDAAIVPAELKCVPRLQKPTDPVALVEAVVGACRQ